MLAKGPLDIFDRPVYYFNIRYIQSCILNQEYSDTNVADIGSDEWPIFDKMFT